ncbi:MAG: hypothetical protein P8Y47_08440 [Alphaproteobacteria bacterium]
MIENKRYLAKIARRERLEASQEKADTFVRKSIIGDYFSADYNATPAGTFQNLDKINLRWLRPDWFEYIPDPERPFSFTRASGEVITPNQMLTDGGTIPRALWVKPEFSPWCYTPCFLVHDWEFDQHHAEASAKTFEDVRDTLAEGLKTLMESNEFPKGERIFSAIYAGVSTDIAREYWDSDE